MEMHSELAERLLCERGLFLGRLGYLPDPGRVARRNNGSIVLYHYTRPERLDQILREGSGLWARLPVVNDGTQPEFDGCHLVEAFLEPLPRWVTTCPYFGDLALEMMRSYVGDLLLCIELPEDFPGLYVADYAHNLECKHVTRRGRAVLNLGYDCRTGHQVCRADVNSYVPLDVYEGGHIAPNVKIVRHSEGIAVPSEYITVCELQPFDGLHALGT